jgi:membrane fusion protein (multidrug efflux system)
MSPEPTDSAPVSTPVPAANAASKPSAQAPQAPPQPPSSRRRLIIVAGVVLLVLIFAVLRFLHTMRTVSTDDAYLNGYVTFVAARVPGQVARVLVDDNNRVKKGDVLLELDSEPYHVQVAIKQAAVDSAQAEVGVAEANARSQIGQARGFRFKLQHAIEDVNNQVALLRARAATLEQSRATLVLAQSEFDRARKLRTTNVTSAEEFERKQEALNVAQAQVKQATESVYQQRAALGLTPEPEEGKSLTDVPPDLDQTFSTVRESLADMMHSVAQLGVVARSYDLKPKQVLEEFYKRDPGGDIDKIYADIIKAAPPLKQAQMKLQQAQRDLDQAQLDLRYCTVVSEIDGVVTRRNVNPGNHVQVGQSLMAIRSLRDIWVDANFKETQLRDLRIGQRAELKVDMYGRKQTFEGRVSGFTMGTGSTLALLPPQNATGNFVKVVQRLPVRIDVVNYDPEKVPLFVGLSVEPEVDIKSKPTGPNAGKYLQEASQPAPVVKP